MEQSLRAPEPLVTNGDDLTVGKLIRLLQGGGGSSSGHLLLEVKSNIAEFLLDVPDNLPLGSGGERVATLGEDLHEVVGELTPSQIQSEDGVREGISLIDGDSVGNTVTRVHHNTGGTTRGVKGEDGLDGDVHGRGVESFEHDLGHFLPVGLGVQWGLSEEDWVFLRSNTEFIVEGVMPDLFHIIQVGDNSVLDWVLQGQDTPLGLGLVTYIGVLLSHTDHDTLVPGASDDGWEDGPGCVVTGETGLAHTGSIINYESS